MRKRIYEILEVSENGDRLSHAYDIFMIVTIFVSLLPLTVKEAVTFWIFAERITTLIFIIDYVLRWATADIKLGKRASSFILYPLHDHQ